MKRVSIFVLVLLSVIRVMGQENEEEYPDEEEIQSEETVEEEEESQNSYFDFDAYFNFDSDQFANVSDKLSDMDPEDEDILYKFIVEVQQDKVLKDRLFRELIAKPKKKGPYVGKDSPGFSCILMGLIENKSVYDAIIKDGRSENQARNAAALSERSVRRKCGVTKKVNKVDEN